MWESGQSLGFSQEDFDPSKLPDFDTEFINSIDLDEFAKALSAPDSAPLVALNDWRPVRQRVRRRGSRTRRKKRKKSKDETREGFLYIVLKWPLLFVIVGASDFQPKLALWRMLRGLPSPYSVSELIGHNKMWSANPGLLTVDSYPRCALSGHQILYLGL